MTEEQGVEIIQKMLPVLEEMKTYSDQNALWLGELFVRACEIAETYNLELLMNHLHKTKERKYVKFINAKYLPKKVSSFNVLLDAFINDLKLSGFKDFVQEN